MTIVISGVAGFIGSNLARRVKSIVDTDVIGIDRMNRDKVKNLWDINLADFIDYDDEIHIEQLLRSLKPGSIFLHQGACTDTLETDGRKMMASNFEKSRRWHSICMEQRHRFIYASSAAVYGHGPSFVLRGSERPLNIYGFSKLMFDQYILHRCQPSQTVGLRYFNVYGQGEGHKGFMASCVHKFAERASATGVIELFEGSDGFLRDFIHIDDVVAVVMHFVQSSTVSGIFNCGTGKMRSFLELAKEIQRHRKCEIRLVKMPDELETSYQKLTKSDNMTLIEAGFRHKFMSLEQGIDAYMKQLEHQCL